MQNTLSDIRVLDGGSNYQNRQLFVKPSGINTSTHTINFEIMVFRIEIK